MGITIQQFAATESTEQSAGLLAALGIDGRLLIVQLISFLILIALMKKFVYPALNKALDEREQSIAASVQAAEKAKVDAEKAEVTITEQLDVARQDAADIVATAHKEATAMMEQAEARAQKKADHIVAEAQAQLDVEIMKARETLRAETIKLVADATERIIGEKMTSATDQKLIEKALKEAA